MHWDTIWIVSPSDTWMPFEIDLGAWAGQRVYVRLTFESVGPSDDVWRVEALAVEVDP